MPLSLEDEYGALVGPLLAVAPPIHKTAIQIRDSVDQIMTMRFQTIPVPKSIERTDFSFPSYDDAKLKIIRAAPARGSSTARQPAWLYFHGGGLVACSADMYWPGASVLAERTGAPVFSVDYRLAPEHPSPCAVEDCFAALAWLHAQADGLGIDPARIGVYGESAGGLLVAALSILGRDRKLQPPIAKQVMLFPMLDDRTTMNPAHPDARLMAWNIHDNKLAWEAWLGEARAGKPDADVRGYEAPGREANLEGLPPAYIEVGDVEIFLQEDLDYASRLAKAGVEIELHVWRGLNHDYEWAAYEVASVQAAVEVRVRALKKL